MDYLRSIRPRIIDDFSKWKTHGKSWSLAIDNISNNNNILLGYPHDPIERIKGKGIKDKINLLICHRLIN